MPKGGLLAVVERLSGGAVIAGGLTETSVGLAAAGHACLPSHALSRMHHSQELLLPTPPLLLTTCRRGLIFSRAKDEAW